MMASFCARAFDVRGNVEIEMRSGQRRISHQPATVWRWLQAHPDWESITVTDDDFDQSFGWDRVVGRAQL